MSAPRPSYNHPDEPLTAARLSLIPRDETPAQRRQRLALEAEARQVSDEIDERLRQEHMQSRRKKVVKVLLLGQSESGKSTALRNFKTTYAPRALRAEALTWRATIHLNLLKMMQIVIGTILQAAIDPSSQIPVTDEHRRLAMRLSPLRHAEELLRMRTSLPEDESRSTWQEDFRKLRGQRGGARTKEEPQYAVILEACADDMIALWSDPLVKNIVRQKCPRFEESSGYFLSDISRMTSRDYMPTDHDILQVSVPTAKVQEHKITLEFGSKPGRVWCFYDFGGSRSQRAAWQPFFDDVNAIIFLAPISAFDQSLAEDRHVNRVQDSLFLWKSVCSSKLLSEVGLVLLLNKCDLLAKKLEAGIRLANFVPGFGDRPNDWETVTRYFRSRFGAIQTEYSPAPRPFFCHLTSGGNPRIIVSNVEDLNFRANLASTFLI